MPITVRKFNAQVKDPESGDMIPAGLLSSDALGAINSAKTDAVAAVEGKQAVAEAAIELKGQTTIASIPDDYTALSNEVDDVKTQISNTNSVLDNMIRPVYETPNIYDVEHNSVVQENPQYIVGTVYLYGYTGNVVISCAGRRTAYMTALHVYDTLGNDMSVSFGATVEYADGSRVREGRLVTIPSGASYFTFKYRIKDSSDNDLVYNVMVTKGSTISSVTYFPYVAHPEYIDAAGKGLKLYPVYVSPNGNDENDGSTAENAVATFNKALEISKFVYAKRGVYNTSIKIENMKDVTIVPFDNGDDWSVNNATRQMIELNGGNDIEKTSFSLVDGLYRANVDGGYQFTSVFIEQRLNPIVEGNKYRANAFVHYNDLSKEIKLKPVLTKTECQNESNTFTWDGTYLWCNVSDTNFKSITVHDINVSVKIINSANVYLEDVYCKYSYSTTISATDSVDIKLKNCEGSYNATASGLYFDNSSCECIECTAIQNGVDGFNFHGFGVSEMYNCKSLYNYDDGCSHHDGCDGYIDGGEFDGNGKDGVCPAYGANVNISNIIAKNNTRHGICYRSSNSGHRNMHGIVSSCAMVGNQYGLGVQALCTVDAIGCKYSNNTNGEKTVAGTLNEY